MQRLTGGARPRLCCCDTDVQQESFFGCTAASLFLPRMGEPEVDKVCSCEFGLDIHGPKRMIPNDFLTPRPFA
ncbi:hypothetical protein DVA76_19035, partial [Acinetobacter baumannii]